jgi:hypothetical protein
LISVSTGRAKALRERRPRVRVVKYFITESPCS